MDMLAASLLSKAKTAGVVRNKVNCLCLDVVVFYLDCFVLEEEPESSGRLQIQEGLPEGSQGGS